MIKNATVEGAKPSLSTINNQTSGTTKTLEPELPIDQHVEQVMSVCMKQMQNI